MKLGIFIVIGFSIVWIGILEMKEYLFLRRQVAVLNAKKSELKLENQQLKKMILDLDTQDPTLEKHIVRSFLGWGERGEYLIELK